MSQGATPPTPPSRIPAGDAEAPRRRRGGPLGLILMVLALAFLAVALVRNWSAVSADLHLLSLADLASSGVAAGAAIILSALAWAVVLAGLGARMPIGPALALFCAGSLGKYIPGSVWVVVMQAQMGARWGVPRGLMAVSYLVAIMVSAGTGAIVGALGLLASGSAVAPIVSVLALLGGVVALVALARPRLMNAVIGRLARATGRSVPPVALPARVLGSALALTTVAWLAFGVHVWLLARPLGAGLDVLPAAVGGFALAFIAGLLLVPLPAGLGLREGILVAVLAGGIGASAALTVSLASRLLLVLVDLLLAVALGAAFGRSGPRGPARTAAAA